jgi:hypothetical protein
MHPMISSIGRSSAFTPQNGAFGISASGTEASARELGFSEAAFALFAA